MTPVVLKIISQALNISLRIFLGLDFKWQELKIKTLGVWLSIEPELTMLLNFQEKTEKVQNALKNWQYRRLSLLGKITILKSLVASQLVNVFSPLQTKYQALKELNEAFYHFLWDGKPDKVKRNVIINEYSDGGLKMIDLLSFNKSLKTIWIKKYLDKTNMGKWKLFFDLELGRYGGEAVFLGNLDKKDTKNHFCTSDIFVNEILLIWAEVNFNNSISSLAQYKTQRLWNNYLIRIDRKPVFFREWLAKGILTVESLIKDGTCFLSYTEFLNKYHCKSCPLAFSGIIATLKTITMRFKENIDSLETVKVESFSKAFQKTKKPSNLTYRNLVATKSEKPRASQAKWYRDCNLNEEEIDWKKNISAYENMHKKYQNYYFPFQISP